MSGHFGIGLITLIAAALVACSRQQASGEAKRPDAMAAHGNDFALRGRWRMTSAMTRGREIPIEQLAGAMREFESDRFVVFPSGLSASYNTDTTVLPHRIAVTYDNGPRARETLHGIYEIRGDELWICVRQDGGPAPDVFESSEGEKTNLDVYERIARGTR